MALAEQVPQLVWYKRDLRIAEVVKQDMTVKNGKIMSFRTRVLLSFKYDA